VTLFIIPYKVVLTFEPADEILKCGHSKQSFEQYFPVVLFVRCKLGFTAKAAKVRLLVINTHNFIRPTGQSNSGIESEN